MLTLSQTYIKKLNLKQYNRLTEIQCSYKYILFSRYYDLTMTELIYLKNCFKGHNVGFLKIKKSLFSKHTYNLKGQGPILIFYCQHFHAIKKLLTILQTPQKIDPLFLSYLKKYIPIIVLKKYCLTVNQPLPYILQSPLMRFYTILIQIPTVRRI